MQTSDRGFEQIMAAVLEQRQVWEKLQAENRELRQQLVDLRAGRGIYVEIANQRFELVWESGKATARLAESASSGKRTPAPAGKETRNAAQPLSPASSGVLEEMLLDELSSAMKNRMSAPGAGDHNSSAPLNEEQKAHLRRELSGSFLLE